MENVHTKIKERESDIVKAIKDYLTFKKCLFIRNNSGAIPTARGNYITFGSLGSPDFIVFTDGGFAVGLECKIKKGRLSPAQEEWKLRAEKIGMEYHIVRDVSFLKEIGL